MGLKIKNMSEIFNNLVEWITTKTDKITDFNVGSAARTLTEAIAIQFEEFYFSMKQNILYSIENSVYNSFGYDLKISQAASGNVTVDFSEPLPESLVFPQGTVFCTSVTYGYIYYESTEEICAEQGSSSVLIPVKCKTTGTIGNVPNNAITTIVTTNPIISEVYNEKPFSNGTNEETSGERKKRFQDYIKTLARGTSDAIVYGCLEVEGVTGAWVDDNYVGYVKLYAHDSNGELPEELRQNILKNIINYRAAGIEVEVLPVIKKPANLSLKIMIKDDYDTEVYKNIIYTLINRHLNEYSVADNLYISDIMYYIKSSYDEVVINVVVESGEDIVVNNNEIIKAGDISISCINKRDWRI